MIRARRKRERGIVLVIALIVLLIVVAIVLELAREARVEVNVATRELDEVKVRAIADSALERALVEIAHDDQPNVATIRSTWRDDEATFRAFQIGEGKAWVYFGEEDPGDGREMKYGVRDEASKLNVNTATRDQLLKLPNMTDEIADSILDWRDQDEDERQFGAESAYYNTLTPPYNAKNGPIESLEEMLRIKGIDESVLYGEDRNLNGILDPCEDDGDKSFPPDDANGVLLRGLVDFLTVYSNDRNVNKNNQTRLPVTSKDGEVYSRLVGQGLAPDMVIAMLQWKNRRGAPPITSPADFLFAPNVDEAAFAVIADELSATNAPAIPGRINVNTASKEVLAGLPTLTDDDVSAIVSRRLNAGEDLSTPAWLLRVLPKQKVRAIFDLVTTRSDQFTVHVAAALDARPYVIRRITALVDRSYSPPRILMRRDITSLGFPLAGERGSDVP